MTRSESASERARGRRTDGRNAPVEDDAEEDGSSSSESARSRRRELVEGRADDESDCASEE